MIESSFTSSKNVDARCSRGPSEPQRESQIAHIFVLGVTLDYQSRVSSSRLVRGEGIKIPDDNIYR
jgi:hypothetical protein